MVDHLRKESTDLLSPTPGLMGINNRKNSNLGILKLLSGISQAELGEVSSCILRPSLPLPSSIHSSPCMDRDKRVQMDGEFKRQL